jgi:hypothetical protein
MSRIMRAAMFAAAGAVVVVAAGGVAAGVVAVYGHVADGGRAKVIYVMASPSASPVQATATADGGSVDLACNVIPDPPSDGHYDYHRGGWVLAITVTDPHSSDTPVVPGYEIDVTTYDASGTQNGYETDYSSSFPYVAPDQSQTFNDIDYDFRGAVPSSAPASCVASFP